MRRVRESHLQPTSMTWVLLQEEREHSERRQPAAIIWSGFPHVHYKDKHVSLYAHPNEYRIKLFMYVNKVVAYAGDFPMVIYVSHSKFTN